MLQRLAIIFVGLSGGIFFIAFCMKEDGAARSWNPAWRLISPIHTALSAVWLGLIGIAILTALPIAIGATFDRIQTIKQRLLAEEQAKAARIKADIEREIHQEVERKVKEAHQLKLEKEKLAHQEHLRRIHEEKRKRSPGDAINAALDDF